MAHEQLVNIDFYLDSILSAPQMYGTYFESVEGQVLLLLNMKYSNTNINDKYMVWCQQAFPNYSRSLEKFPLSDLVEDRSINLSWEEFAEVLKEFRFECGL